MYNRRFTAIQRKLCQPIQDELFLTEVAFHICTEQKLIIMRKLILFSLIITMVSLSACKKSSVDRPVDPPPAGFTLNYMEVQENLYGADLYLYGIFGDSSSSSKVRVGNTLLDGKPSGEGLILTWTPGYIKVSIGDVNDNTGAGYISVLNNGKETNKRMLNVWEVDMQYKEPDEGTIFKAAKIHAYLRADVDPHPSTYSFSMPSSFASTSDVNWSIGGQGHASYTGGGMTITLDHSEGSLLWSDPFHDHTNDQQEFKSSVKFNKGAFELSDLRLHKLSATNYTYLADGSPEPYTILYDFRVVAIPLNEIVKLELDNNKAIKAGTYVTGPHGTQYDFTWDASDANIHMHNYTLRWEKAEPRFKL